MTSSAKPKLVIQSTIHCHIEAKLFPTIKVFQKPMQASAQYLKLGAYYFATEVERGTKKLGRDQVGLSGPRSKKSTALEV